MKLDKSDWQVISKIYFTLVADSLQAKCGND